MTSGSRSCRVATGFGAAASPPSSSGSSAALAGAIAFPLNQSLSTTTDLNTGARVHVPNASLRGASIGLMAGGVTVLAGGIAMLVMGRTKVKVTDQQQAGGTGGAAKPRYWLGEF